MIRVLARHPMLVVLFVLVATALGTAYGVAVSTTPQDQNDSLATIALRVEGMT